MKVGAMQAGFLQFIFKTHVFGIYCNVVEPMKIILRRYSWIPTIKF